MSKAIILSGSPSTQSRLYGLRRWGRWRLGATYV
ncbi:hypothetical protein QOZ95_003264 [Paenibacillus brasilensis]|uniref:Uncharacterized protein n=1 Tax=Paenibacillus brasilensis TaxID=128574 RepID=A0ABU0L2P0_9BACL|nr:hypothetical protein [Paenibacillus brasilensis]